MAALELALQCCVASSPPHHFAATHVPHVLPADGAKGPYRLDLGDVLYAPNVCQDGQVGGRAGGWVRDGRAGGLGRLLGC